MNKYRLSRGSYRGSAPSGFTLIELMITVAIVAIIAAVAYPSYQDSVRKSRRTDARSVLMDYAARQERYFSRNNRYANTLGAGTADYPGLNVSATSENGYYSVVLNSGPLADYDESYGLTATAADTQTQDTDCLTFTINSQGTKTGCWER